VLFKRRSLVAEIGTAPRATEKMWGLLLPLLW
jgi:hypothetical protein